jgi:hypothetical protein
MMMMISKNIPGLLLYIYISVLPCISGPELQVLKPKSIEVDIVHVVFSISLKIRIRTEGAWEGCPSQYDRKDIPLLLEGKK